MTEQNRFINIKDIKQRLFLVSAAAGSLFLSACGQIPFYAVDSSLKDNGQNTQEQLQAREIRDLIHSKIRDKAYKNLLTDPSRTDISWGLATPGGSGFTKTEKGDIIWKFSTKADIKNKKAPINLAMVSVHRDDYGRISRFTIGIDTQVNRKNGINSDLDQFLDPQLAPDYAGSRLEEVLRELFDLPEDTAFQTKSPFQTTAWGEYQIPGGVNGKAQVYSYGTAYLTESMLALQR